MPGICRIPPEERWERCRELLLLADPDPLMVERYLPACEMLALWRRGEGSQRGVRRAAGGRGLGAAAMPATRPELEGRGYASALIREVQRQAREAGGRWWWAPLQEGVGFYRRLGFVPCGVRRGFSLQYQEPVLENGTVLEDMQMLRWSKEETEWTL